jgi:molybdate transport system regulatory protein
MNNLEVRSKIWIEAEGEPVLGTGREQLLRLIQENGSISAAARGMGLSYRKAWSLLRAMETSLGYPLVRRQKGGSGGGESALTPRALDLLEKFDRLHAGIRRYVNDRFREIF